MRSKLGFVAALAFLLAIPAALLVEIIFGSGAETIIHFMCGAGFALSAFAVFDFKLPGWITGIGFVAASGSAVIWLLQGLSNLIQNDALHFLAFQVLGQGLESWLIDLFIVWLVALLFIDSQGITKILGFVVLSLVVIMEVYRYSLGFLGGNAAESLKLFYLLAIVWLLFESKKAPENKVSSDYRGSGSFG
jgi:hypothetical protein